MTTTTERPEITVEKIGQIAVVTLDRPPNNHVSVPLMRDLADLMEKIDRDDTVRAVVLASAGKAFCAGADLVAPDGIGGSGMNGINDLYTQAVRLFSVETPIVAAVQGAAVGAGLGLALVADFRIASPEARFTANFVKLGFHPGRRVKPEEALAWGLVDEVVPQAQLLEAAKALAAEIAENAPLAVVATRKTLRAGLAAAVQAQTDHEHGQQTILRATEDFAEGVRAVAERRPGNFRGR
jgi:enoyl-CoA hydratase/carnithine racemase